jgi:hypothetical protein
VGPRDRSRFISLRLSIVFEVARRDGRRNRTGGGEPVPGVQPGVDPLPVPAGADERGQDLRTWQARPAQYVGERTARQDITIAGGSLLQFAIRQP